jgi:hypothetical protein
MKTILETIKKNRPNLSNSSIKTYISSINAISNNIKKELTTPKSLVENYKLILESMADFKPNPRKTKIAAIISVIDDKHNEHSKEITEALDAYRKQMFDDADVIAEKDKKQKMSINQELNFITWDEVMEIYEEVKAIALPYLKLKRITDKQFFAIQNYILLSLYVLIPPRRSLDYVDFKLRNIDTERDNYMVRSGKTANSKAEFVFNSYKNASRLGRQTITIPKDLANLIEKWGKINSGEWLLTTIDFKPITQTRVTSMLNKIFKKKISTSMLRHIYLTKHFGNVDLESLEEVTREMGSKQISRTLAYVSKANVEKEKDEEVNEVS